jgi:hypothetical protein
MNPEEILKTKLSFCPFCGQKLTDPLEVELKNGEVLYQLFRACVSAPATTTPTDGWFAILK